MQLVMSAGGDDFQRLLRQLETIDHKHKVCVGLHHHNLLPMVYS